MLKPGYLRRQVRALDEGDAVARRDVVRALKHHDGQDWAGAPHEALDALITALRAHFLARPDAGATPLHPVFVQEVVTLLGNMGRRARVAVPQLLRLLDEGVVHSLRLTAVAALGRIGHGAKPAVPRLLELLGAESAAALSAPVARALGEIGCADAPVRAALVRLWLGPETCQDTRLQAGLSLCKLRLDAPGLLECLTSTLVIGPGIRLRRPVAQTLARTIRRPVAEALSYRPKEDLDVVPALTAVLDDEDEEIRRLAEQGLSRLGLSRADALGLCAAQLHASVHAEAALRRSGVVALAALVGALQAGTPVAREKAARALGAIGEPAAAAAPALRTTLGDRSREVRLAAAKALWNVSRESAAAVVPALTALLKPRPARDGDDPESGRRFVQTVIEALGRIGPAASAALPALADRAGDENRLIRESALRAIQDIGLTAAARP